MIRMFYKPWILLTALMSVFALLLTIPSASATTWKWVNSGQYDEYTQGSFTWLNDSWGSGAGPQTIYVNSPSDWAVTSNQKWTPYDVQTYPDIFANPRGHVDSYGEIISTVTESSPSGPGEYNEAAYDIWLNGPNNHLNAGGTEVMVWTDAHNVSPSNYVGTYDIYGTSYRFYRSGGMGGGEMYSFVQVENTTHQTTHIKAILDWLANNGGPKNGVLSAVDFGWEIWGTVGTQTFHCSQFTLNT